MLILPLFIIQTGEKTDKKEKQRTREREKEKEGDSELERDNEREGDRQRVNQETKFFLKNVEYTPAPQNATGIKTALLKITKFIFMSLILTLFFSLYLQLLFLSSNCFLFAL